MKLTNLKDVKIFTSSSDRSKIYAEYFLPKNKKSKSPTKKFVDIDSSEFKSYLRLVVLPNIDEEISAEKFVQRIKDICTVYGNDDVVDVNVRTAGKLSDGLIEYALKNSDQQIVRIDSTGWTIKNDSTYKFIDNGTSGAQILPKHSSKSLLSLLKKHINADKQSIVLFIIWLVQSFCEGMHSALLICAPKGSGKSRLSRCIRKLLDPSKIDISAFLSAGDNLVTTLTNSYLVILENTRALSQSDSDLLCTAVTGGSYSKRTAYSTNELSVYDLQNVIVVNGIDIIPAESDFAERCLLLNLRPISPESRKSETELNKTFDEALPFILGGIFTTISKAITIFPTLNPKRMPRMADSYLEMLAIAIALGISEEKFNKIYYDNLNRIEKARSNTDFIFAIRECLQACNGRSLEGTATAVYSRVVNGFSGNKSALPKSAAAFSRKLSAEYGTLLSVGIRANIDNTHADGTHIKLIQEK